MGKLCRALAVMEFVAIGLVTVCRFGWYLIGGNPVAGVLTLILGAVAVLFAMPLYVLGNLVDEVRMLREKVMTPAPVNQEVHNRQLMASGGWKCSCGRTNADYISTCACGKGKHEAE